MRTLILSLILAVLSATGAVARADTRMDIGATLVNGGLKGFYLALGEYYRVPEPDIVVLHDRHVPDNDLPVVMYIAQRARVAPALIVDMRLAGRSWMDISLHFGLGPDIYYVPVKKVYGPPYGNAYGYYKNKPRKDWKSIRLSDADIVNMVNLRFISERYHYSPEEVMRMRSDGKNFVHINDEIRHGKHEKEYLDQGHQEYRSWENQKSQGSKKSKGSGKSSKGKGKGHDKD